MKLSKNIYDLNDISDLPKEVIGVLSKPRRLTMSSQLISLFSDSNELNADQIIVALYRKYKVVTDSRNKLLARIHYLITQGKLSSAGVGTYKKQTKVEHENM
ncbi:MAG: hypothetical protein WC495_03700 [Patescibacteria group bacterium]